MWRRRIRLKKLISVMQERGMSKSETAFQACLDLSRFSRIVNGWILPNELEREKIARAVGFEKKELFPEIENKEGA